MSTDRYEIRGKIGQGGVGAVYRAYDTQLRREVAMKRVLQDGEMNSEDATANLLKEATALSSVQHPHIVTVYDAGIDGEGPYVVMELINGKTLDEMVERGTLTFEDFKEVAVQSQEAMIAAQDLDLVHRDLKPSNVMVSWLPSGRFQVKIVDFGLAKFSAKPSLQTIDHGDAVFGSIFFMAPEQFERTPLDRRTDMYSLGAMYYYALSGDYPFNGDTAPQVMAAHLQNKVTPLIEIRPDLPPWVCDWVMWHIRRDMNDRPDSARAALEHFLAHDSAHTFGVTATQPLQAAAPAATAGAVAVGVSGNTAPQPILSPSGQVNPHTASHRLVSGATTAPLQTATQVAAQPAVVAPQVAAPQPAVTQQHVAPVHPVENPELLMAQNKGKLSMVHYIIIGAILIGIIIGLVLILSGRSKDGDVNTRVNKLVSQLDKKDRTSPIPITKGECNLLLNIVAGKVKDYPEEAKNGPLSVLRVAESSDGTTDIDLVIADYVTKDSDLASTTKIKLLKDVLANRAYLKNARTTAFKPILDWTVADPSHKAATAALTAVKAFANAGDDFKKILTIAMKTKDDIVRNTAGGVMGRIITDEKDPEKLVAQLEESFTSTKSENVKKVLISSAAFGGDETALKLMKQGISSDDEKMQIFTIKAMATWPNSGAIDTLCETVRSASPASATGKQIRELGIKSLMKIARSSALRDNEDIQDHWGKIVSLAANDSERNVMIQILGSLRKQWAVKFLTQMQADARSQTVKDRAQAGVKNVNKLLADKK